jgi:hypothetical protein
MPTISRSCSSTSPSTESEKSAETAAPGDGSVIIAAPWRVVAATATALARLATALATSPPRKPRVA